MINNKNLPPNRNVIEDNRQFYEVFQVIWLLVLLYFFAHILQYLRSLTPQPQPQPQPQQQQQRKTAKQKPHLKQQQQQQSPPPYAAAKLRAANKRLNA